MISKKTKIQFICKIHADLVQNKVNDIIKSLEDETETLNQILDIIDIRIESNTEYYGYYDITIIYTSMEQDKENN